ncbi:MAG TPA: helix-turn-helix transcriptional regulator [Clostridiaceae bacterium]|nr:helix-turn-helix transcriptional regulator [Clostridiaceae bacterium]
METLGQVVKAVQEQRENEKVMSMVERWEIPSGNGSSIWANKGDVLDNYLEKAISIIREQYMNNLSLKSVADQLYISESYLAKLFKNRMNYTFLELLTLYRMKEAVRLLEQSD